MKDSSGDEVQLNYALHLMDIVVLLYHVHKGSKESDVGFEDADRTLQELTKLLCQRRVTVKKSALESALWSCNLMNERKKFWHPEGKSFKAYLAKILRPYGSEFDHFYNWILESKENGKEAKAKT